MNEHEEPTTAKVVVQFTRSSSKDGGEGYTIRVAEGVDVGEATRVMETALYLRNGARDALRPPDYAAQLEASVAAAEQKIKEKANGS